MMSAGTIRNNYGTILNADNQLVTCEIDLIVSVPQSICVSILKKWS